MKSVPEQPLERPTSAEVRNVLKLLSRRKVFSDQIPSTTNGKIIESLESNSVEERISAVNQLKNICSQYRDQKVLAHSISALYSILSDDVEKVRITALNALHTLSSSDNFLLATLVFSSSHYFEICFNLLVEKSFQVVSAVCGLLTSSAFPKIKQVLLVAKAIIERCSNVSFLQGELDIPTILHKLGEENAAAVALETASFKKEAKKFPLLLLVIEGAEASLSFSITTNGNPVTHSPSFEVKSKIDDMNHDTMNAVLETVWGDFAQGCLARMVYADLFRSLESLLKTPCFIPEGSLLWVYVQCAKIALEERESTERAQKRANLVLPHMDIPLERKKQLLAPFAYPPRPELASAMKSSIIRAELLEAKVARPLLKEFPDRLSCKLKVYNCPMAFRKSISLAMELNQDNVKKRYEYFSIDDQCWGSTSKESISCCPVAMTISVPTNKQAQSVQVILGMAPFDIKCILARRTIVM